ncbi:hypothetical protein FXE95_11490 [Vibrio cholerae]|nr:hypothetical protein FLL71_16500 [Vibrio cholerae]TXX79770.1 hypothetical protein FXE95_11490 [Vibrio cholerae]
MFLILTHGASSPKTPSPDSGHRYALTWNSRHEKASMTLALALRLKQILQEVERRIERQRANVCAIHGVVHVACAY